MNFDLLFRQVRLVDTGPDGAPVDVAVAGGKIAEIGPNLSCEAVEVVDGAGRLLAPGFVETHIHLDKSCVIDRCACETGRAPAPAARSRSASSTAAPPCAPMWRWTPRSACAASRA
jgi:cytosine deaminase